LFDFVLFPALGLAVHLLPLKVVMKAPPGRFPFRFGLDIVAIWCDSSRREPKSVRIEKRGSEKGNGKKDRY